jgi:hypothetical protein
MKVSYIIAATGIFLFIGISSGYSQQFKIPRGGEKMYNIDLMGSDIHKIVFETPVGMFDRREDMCADACWKEKNCQAWTYVRPNTIQGPNGNCWIKHSVPAPQSNTCCVSGTIGEANIDRPGSDYKNFKGDHVTPQLCQETCHKEEKCKAWTFVKPNTFQGPQGVCWLKDSVPPPVKNNSCISGYFEIEVVK